MQTIITLSDGTCIGAGSQGVAIQSATLTQSVNTGQELALGSVCAAMAEVTFHAPDGCPIGAGDSFTLYKTSASGQRHKLGVFTAEQPQWISRHRVRITAYDPVVKLDRDITGWLSALDGWPYTLQELAGLVCAHCGVSLGQEELPNGDFAVEQFCPDQATGRDLMRWIGQAAGRFCVADPEGVLRFGWYKPAQVSLGPQEVFGITVTDEDGHLTVTGLENAEATDDDRGNVTVWGKDCRYYRLGGLQLQTYATAPITALWLRGDDRDTGVLYPDGAGENPYAIRGNPLLRGTAEKLLPVAKTLFEGLRDFSHTPMTVTAAADLRFYPGQLVQVCDSRGNAVTGCIMQRTLTGNTDTLIGAGSRSLQSTTAVNNRTYKDLTGRLLHLRTDIDGIRASHQITADRVAELELTAQGIDARVQRTEQTEQTLKETMAKLALEADAIKATVTSVVDDGVERVQNRFGLTIDGSCISIQRAGRDMTNRLDERGMSVVRGSGNAETVMLRADAQGVLATDVTVRNYLRMGKHARFEDYGSRTACFYTKGDS